MRQAQITLRKSLGWVLAVVVIVLCVLFGLFQKARMRRSRNESDEVITLPPRVNEVVSPQEYPGIHSLETSDEKPTITKEAPLESVEDIFTRTPVTTLPKAPLEQVQVPVIQETSEERSEVKGDASNAPTQADKVEAILEVAYCVKCRQKQTMLSPERSVTKNGRAALVGRCAVCDTKLFRFVSA
ncbi:DUF5679 domain-containing protein [Ktedonospora formicarum]|uniref:DUF5679 domain-containing protein n=1 Tax=Ktedonospora formicarum TaxID=2778364 RepID=A0A8J3MSR0_9CHLR|nr:DUF5679 domain-containing protein [Ktedonospora formicarum]GHO43595.1 hypothetical protein KSX_17580 [Ktedonospora formicarum]